MAISYNRPHRNEQHKFAGDGQTIDSKQSGLMIGGIYTSSTPSLSNNEASFLRIDSDGYLLTKLKSSISLAGDLEIDVTAFEDTSGNEVDAIVYDHDEDISGASPVWQGFGGYDETADRFRALPIATDNEAMPANTNFLPIGGEYNATPVTLGDGDAGVLQLNSDGALLVKDTSAGTDVLVITQTGSGAISYTTSISDEFKIEKVLIKFDTAPTTSEDLEINLDSNTTGYDMVLDSEDPSATSMTQYEETLGNMSFVNGDELNVTYTNTDSRTWHMLIYYRLV